MIERKHSSVFVGATYSMSLSLSGQENTRWEKVRVTDMIISLTKKEVTILRISSEEINNNEEVTIRIYSVISSSVLDAIDRDSYWNSEYWDRIC